MGGGGHRLSARPCPEPRKGYRSEMEELIPLETCVFKTKKEDLVTSAPPLPCMLTPVSCVGGWWGRTRFISTAAKPAFPLGQCEDMSVRWQGSIRDKEGGGLGKRGWCASGGGLYSKFCSVLFLFCSVLFWGFLLFCRKDCPRNWWTNFLGKKDSSNPRLHLRWSAILKNRPFRVCEIYTDYYQYKTTIWIIMHCSSTMHCTPYHLEFLNKISMNLKTFPSQNDTIWIWTPWTLVLRPRILWSNFTGSCVETQCRSEGSTPVAHGFTAYNQHWTKWYQKHSSNDPAEIHKKTL